MCVVYTVSGEIDIRTKKYFIAATNKNRNRIGKSKSMFSALNNTTQQNIGAQTRAI